MFHWININLFWFLTEKIICCFISRSFSSGIMKCYISGTICKIVYFETQNATFVGIWEKLLLFETQIATFVGISENLLLFYWKCYISFEIYKFATFSINYVKLKLFNQLLQRQFIVANILVPLDCLNLLRIFNFLDIFYKHCSVNTL